MSGWEIAWLKRAPTTRRLRETEDELECLLDLVHFRFRKLTGEAWQAIPGVDEAGRVERADLKAQEHRVGRQATLVR